MLRNCVNCGAPLHGRECQYCGTMYSGDGIYSDFGKADGVVTFNVYGEEFKCYISSMEAHTIYGENSGRDMSGRLLRDRPMLKHKFVLVEV